MSIFEKLLKPKKEKALAETSNNENLENFRKDLKKLLESKISLESKLQIVQEVIEQGNYKGKIAPREMVEIIKDKIEACDRTIKQFEDEIRQGENKEYLEGQIELLKVNIAVLERYIDEVYKKLPYHFKTTLGPSKETIN